MHCYFQHQSNSLDVLITTKGPLGSRAIGRSCLLFTNSTQLSKGHVGFSIETTEELILFLEIDHNRRKMARIGLKHLTSLGTHFFTDFDMMIMNYPLKKFYSTN